MQMEISYLTSIGLSGEQINKIYQKFSIHRIIRPGRIRKPMTETQRMVIEKVCEYFCLDFDYMLGVTQRRQYAEPRFIIFYILYSKGLGTYTAIADLFNRDHTTVIHGISTLHKLKDTDERYSHDVSKLERIVNEIINQ